MIRFVTGATVALAGVFIGAVSAVAVMREQREDDDTESNPTELLARERALSVLASADLDTDTAIAVLTATA